MGGNNLNIEDVKSNSKDLPILMIETAEINGRVFVKKVAKFFESLENK